jgi:hypothetical protein
MKKIFNILALILAVLLIISGCTPDNSGITNDVNNSVNNSDINNNGVGNNDIDSNDNDNNEINSNDIDGSDTDSESTVPKDSESMAPTEQDEPEIDEDGTYSGPLLVAKYIHTYNKLPSNYITKKEASKLGWESDEGNLWEVTDKMSIGGDKFGNKEGLLPKKEGRIYYECDVNYEGGYRGAERIVFSNDGLIFYTDDHYESFTQLY